LSESQGQDYLKSKATIRLGAAGAFHREITIEGSVVHVTKHFKGVCLKAKAKNV
jgi:hypothetical protein